MPKAKTVERDKKLQQELDDYRKTSNMSIEHALAVIFGNRMKKGE